MEEGSKIESELKTIQSVSQNPKEWKEFNDFYDAHGVQLYGLGFPKDLCDKLYFKLKHEIYDSGRYFEIHENPDDNLAKVISKQTIESNMEVFLVDHFWTFKLRQLNNFLDEAKYPTLTPRLLNMLRYKNEKQPIQNQNKEEDELPRNPIEYMENLKKSGNFEDLDYDDFGIEKDLLEHLIISEDTLALSLQFNQIDNIDELYKVLDKFKNIKALWVKGNPFCETIKDYEDLILTKYNNIEILNRKFTKNTTKWVFDYIRKLKKSEDQLVENNQVYFDLSGRNPLNANLSIFKDSLNDINVLDLRENDENILNNFESRKFVEFLLLFPKLRTILVDPEIELELINFILIFHDQLKKHCPEFKYVNEIELDIVFPLSTDELEKLHNNYFINKNVWKIAHTYRLMTFDKYDEESIWYVMDELGTYIRHSDKPNFMVAPFVFSKSNKFENDMITYSIMWPISKVVKGIEVTRDYLHHINENQQRSVRLTTWFDTPKDYFKKKFQDKIKKLNQAKEKSQKFFSDFEENQKKIISKIDEILKEREILSDEDKSNITALIDETFNFKLLNLKALELKIDAKVLKTQVIDNIINSIILTLKEKDLSLNSDTKFKVFSDLPYVRENLKSGFWEISNNVEESDLLWLNVDYFTIPLNNKINSFYFGDSTENKGSLKPIHYKNQYPFENIITMKSHLMSLINDNFGICNFFNISYDMETELSEIIGHYQYNETAGINNTWILKPVNMTRSMDMIVTSSLEHLIRNVETGPKICQKYMNNPFLYNGRKFDLRFIVLLKKLVPLELYMYSKVFWVRVANNQFTLDSLTLNNYETHFTVMNYNKEVQMQQVFDKDFLEYLKERGIDWSDIYGKIKEKIRLIFTATAANCPQMTDYYARSIYGLDIMIDENLDPYVLELNFSPDCTRACKFTPEFFEDIFSTFFLNKESGVEKI